MKPRIYLETTIASYLTAWPSRDLVTAAHQQITREWWEKRRKEFDLYVSQLVIQEASRGDPEAAARREEVLKGIQLLSPKEEALVLSGDLLKKVPLPAKAAIDAGHIALAVVHGMDYLLTWNCAHLANAELRPKIEAVCRFHGYEPPILCTPEELLEG